MAEKNKDNELRIKGISQKTLNEVKNIAENAGVTMSNLLRPEIAKIVESYPERMRIPRPKD